MSFNAQAEADAIAIVVAKQAAQYKPQARRFASLHSHNGLLHAVATDGTAWRFQVSVWNRIDDLPVSA